MTALAIIGFITILLFAVVTAIMTFQMAVASLFHSDYLIAAILFAVLTVGALMLAWHLSPFIIVMKPI